MADKKGKPFLCFEALADAIIYLLEDEDVREKMEKKNGSVGSVVS